VGQGPLVALTKNIPEAARTAKTWGEKKSDQGLRALGQIRLNNKRGGWWSGLPPCRKGVEACEGGGG